MSDKKHRTSRGELLFRLWFSLAGLGLMVAGLVYRGLPVGPAGYEAIGAAAIFFGGTCGWTVFKLWRGEYVTDED